MAEEVKVVKKKRKQEIYPSKTTLNLYYRDDRGTKASTATLYALFAVVMLLACVKFLVVDMIVESNDLKAQVQENQTALEQLYDRLTNYHDVNIQYNEYTNGYLMDHEILCDRLDILTMLEETVFESANVEGINILSSEIRIEFTGVDLQTTSTLAKKIESYDMVSKVSIISASLSAGIGTYEVVMSIEVNIPAESEGGAA